VQINATTFQILAWINLTSTYHVTSVYPWNNKIHLLSQTFLSNITFMEGYAVEKRLRHYATSREVAGSRPDEVNEFFDLPNPSNSTKPWSLLSL
jgi:hypothetical protein